MAATLPLDTVPDRPELLVEVDGAGIEPSVRDDIIAVEVHEELGRHARATLLVRNWDDDRGRVAHSDSGPFAPGAGISLQLGYRGDLAPTFDGVVTALRARFLTHGQPVLEVHARTRGVLLAGKRRTRAFDDVSDGRVATTVAGDHGLQAIIEDGASHEHLVQFDESDWDLLARRAHTLGFVLYVRGTELVFRRPDRSGRAEVSLEWGATLLEVDLTHDLSRTAAHALATGWDAGTLETVEAEEDPDATPFAVDGRPKPGASVDDAGWPSRSYTRPHSGALGAEEVAAAAAAEAERQALAHISGRGRCLGVPRLRVDAWLELGALGERFSGVHYVTATRHTLGVAGYFTEFQVGLPPPLAPLPDRSSHPRLDGLYAAVVEDLDDPLGWGRVKVSFPWVGPEPLSLWARLALPSAGPDQGFFFVPDPGHEVVVSFLNADPQFAVVVGSLWNGRHPPPLELDASENGVRGVVSRSGHRLLLDDSAGAESVRIQTNGGHTLVLDDARGQVSLHEQGGNGITVDSAGVTIEAVQGDVSVKSASGKVQLTGASGLEGRSQGPMRLESTATLDLQASAVLGITGALVKINS